MKRSIIRNLSKKSFAVLMVIKTYRSKIESILSLKIYRDCLGYFFHPTKLYNTRVKKINICVFSVSSSDVRLEKPSIYCNPMYLVVLVGEPL
ncbi:hypothetical protein PUN28_004798 [Cardiocondyla obscurior]|uniref:Uncharacterized protein n=1 Tax=Cardiocondyla obscurior TaxID=286306 RepID=A0AAW2GCN6_9HYME